MLSASDGGGVALPPDLSVNPAAAAAAQAAGLTSQPEYTSILNMPIKLNGKYNFWFTYLYKDPDTGAVIEGPRSPLFSESFTIPNLTKAVQSLTLTPGYKAYSVKFTVDPTSVQEDIVIYESLTGAFSGEQYVVYIGTSTNVTIQTNSTAPRWVKVRTRDKWVDTNVSDAVAGPVTPLNPDPDTSTPGVEPTVGTSTPALDVLDKTGFSGMWTVTWTANNDTNTGGYVIRWSTDNPATITNPTWEYGQVEGKATTSFTITGLLPNTTYYWQITSKSPYNAISWTGRTVRTFGPIVDPNAPADVWAQLRSVLSIGGKTADLFKIGTGISQAINTSTTTTASMVSGNYNGIILNKSTTNFGHNYWLNTGQFRVGSSTAFLYWDGSDLYTTGKINATGGSFTGDVKLDGGTLYAGALPNSGQRVRLNSSGIFAYNSSGTQTFSLDTAGYVNATSGLIGGWTLGSTTLSANNVNLNSAGVISLGSTVSQSIYLSATDATYRIWAGTQSSTNAPFRVTKDGVLYATGAQISGVITITSGTTYDAITNAKATADTAKTTADNAAAAAASATTTANTANTNATTATTTANNAFTKANAALPSSSFNRAAIVQYINSTTSNPTNTTSIDGGTLITGTVSANAVVADFISAFSLNADKITAGTLTGRDISIADDTLSNRFRTSYNRTTPDGLTTVSSLGVNAIAMVSLNTSGVVSSWYPYLEASNDLGTTTYRWRNLRYYGALTTTSDARIKRDITNSDLGLDFIRSLRPVKYHKIYPQKTDKLDENGNVMLDENGNRILEQVDILEGDRWHYGFIAQEVKEVLDSVGIGDQFAGWLLDDKNDPDSRQGLAYDDFISPLTKAVQELANMVESLQQEVNILKGV